MPIEILSVEFNYCRTVTDVGIFEMEYMHDACVQVGNFAREHLKDTT